jgi:hypothetical protein
MYRRTHHYGLSNLAQYRYVKKKYSRKTRLQLFWFTTGLVLLLVGAVIGVQLSETDAQRSARAEKLEQDHVRVVCENQSKDACDKAQEAFRRDQSCHPFGECTPAEP